MPLDNILYSEHAMLSYEVAITEINHLSLIQSFSVLGIKLFERLCNSSLEFQQGLASVYGKNLQYMPTHNI